jgi:hypothetical protein
MNSIISAIKNWAHVITSYSPMTQAACKALDFCSKLMRQIAREDFITFVAVEA